MPIEKMHRSYFKILFYAISLSLIMGACAHYEDLVRGGKTQLQVVPPKDAVKISNSHIYKQNDGFQVSGQVQHAGLGIASSHSGHIDIAIFSSEGKVWNTKSSNILSISTVQHFRRKVNPVYFSVQFSDDLPVGSKVFLAFHSDKMVVNGDCENNPALQAGLYEQKMLP